MSKKEVTKTAKKNLKIPNNSKSLRIFLILKIMHNSGKRQNFIKNFKIFLKFMNYLECSKNTRSVNSSKTLQNKKKKKSRNEQLRKSQNISKNSEMFLKF